MQGVHGSENMRRCAKFATVYYDGVNESACELLELNLLHRAARIRVGGLVVTTNLN